MRLLALLAAGLFAGNLMAADDKKDEKKVKDAEAILGTWKVETLDGGDGKSPPAEVLDKLRMVFKKGGKMTTAGPDGKDKEVEYTLEPTATPKAIDLKGEGKSIPGVYVLDGDTLTLCAQMHAAGDEKVVRPTELKADAKKRIVVLTLKRVKDEPKKDK